MRISSIFVIAITFLLFITSCANQEEEDRKTILNEKIDSELAKVSFELALLKAHVDWAAELNCLMSDVFNNSKATKNIGNTKQSICSVFKEAKEFTSIVSSAAIQNNKIIHEGYIFYAQRGTTFEGEERRLGLIISDKGDEPVGLFESVDRCQLAEKTLRNLDISTRSCRKWGKTLPL